MAEYRPFMAIFLIDSYWHRPALRLLIIIARKLSLALQFISALHCGHL